MNKLFLIIVANLATLSASLAQAEQVTPVGTQTKQWLQLQTSGKVAAQGPANGVPGEVADRVYQRYLESFTKPIPERMERENLGGESTR